MALFCNFALSTFCYLQNKQGIYRSAHGAAWIFVYLEYKNRYNLRQPEAAFMISPCKVFKGMYQQFQQKSFLKDPWICRVKKFLFHPWLKISGRSSSLNMFPLLEGLYRNISVFLAFREFPSREASCPEGMFGDPWLCYKKKCCAGKTHFMITCLLAVPGNRSKKWTFLFGFT